MLENLTMGELAAIATGISVGTLAVTITAIHYCLHKKVWRKIWPEQPVAEAVEDFGAPVVKLDAAERGLIIAPDINNQHESNRTSKTLTYSFDCGSHSVKRNEAANSPEETPVNVRPFARASK